jgi:membrane protease YdiL (CAAX protease family)
MNDDSDNSLVIISPWLRALQFSRAVSLFIVRSTPVLLLFVIVCICFEMSAVYLYITFVGTPHKTFGLMCLYVAYSYVWFLIIPSLFNYFVRGLRYKDIGVCLPIINVENICYFAGGMIFIVPFAIFFSKFHQFQTYSYAGISLPVFYLLQFVVVPLYYFAEEFFFRGFLFLTLWNKIRWHSFWVTDILFTLAHTGKPGLEVLLCIPASVIFNFLTLKTRSIFPGMIVHGTMGILLNFLVNAR